MKYHVVNAKLNPLELCTAIKHCVWKGTDLLILRTFFFCSKWLFLHIASQMRSGEITSVTGWAVVSRSYQQVNGINDIATRKSSTCDS